MFSIFRRNRKSSESKPESGSEIIDPIAVRDTALIAVIAAAIARYREQDRSVSPAVGFIVRRVRRV
jgi:Na+-transporting methylmalonyl-CoA/oxaloacetate decarboxylase gamma subunit